LRTFHLPSEATPKRAPRRAALRWLRRIAVALAIWLLASYAVAYRLTCRRRPPFPEPIPSLDWCRMEPLRLRARDGEQLGAWFHEGRLDAPSVLLLHGNGGSRWNCLSRAEPLVAEGCSVLMISLRAHGDSSGDFNDIGYSARRDVLAAVEFLEGRRPGRPVVVHGTSLGAAAAVFASEELGRRVAGYILENPYRDLKVAVWNRLDDVLPPLLDALAYRGLLTVAPLVLPELQRIAPADAIGGIPEAVPVLIIAGGRDRRARPEEARELHRRVAGHGRLVVFERADHLRALDSDPGRFRREVLSFLGEIGRAGEARQRPD
jgi:alpha-beta hydrolase superfamily lysophospholipase